MDLAGKVVLVTGASSGIGRALVAELAARGSRLVLTALDAPGLAAVAEEARARSGASVEHRAADVTVPAELEALVAWIRSRGQAPDVVVSNAGGGTFARFAAAAWADHARTLALNVEAPTRLLHALLPSLARRPEGRIVIVSSAIGRLPYPGLAVYGAAKGYLTSLGETLACELLGTRVRVLVFFPGFTATGFMAAAGMDMRRVPGFLVGPPEKVARRIVRSIETGRQWAFSDLPTRLSALLGPLVPSRLRVRILRNLFWRLPDEG